MERVNRVLWKLRWILIVAMIAQIVRAEVTFPRDRRELREARQAADEEYRDYHRLCIQLDEMTLDQMRWFNAVAKAIEKGDALPIIPKPRPDSAKE